jgi:hypothetical protein
MKKNNLSIIRYVEAALSLTIAEIKERAGLITNIREAIADNCRALGTMVCDTN